MLTTNNPEYEKLHETALKAPSSSGVYLWRNHEETVIYVGKAKNLKNRLSSYFSGNRAIKTELLVSNAASIEYITTANEYEAFLLENNLIKKYSPRYNIQLKDGKSYPVLKITNEEFPRFYKTRQVHRTDGASYFGPYPDSGALDTFIDSLYKVYPVRHCRTFKKREAPCMYYHIGRCKAPCCNKIDKETYNLYIDEIRSLLEGKGTETQEKITAQMKEAAAALNFEKAARLRDGLRALTIMQNQNIVEDFAAEDRDYIAHWREGELVSFTVLKIRDGKLLGRDNYRVESLNEDDELLEEFARAYYSDATNLPPKIFIDEKDKAEFLEQWLKQVENGKRKTESLEGGPASPSGVPPFANAHSLAATSGLHTLPQDGVAPYLPQGSILERVTESSSRRDIAALNMARENAKEDIIRRVRERGDMPALNELKDLLHLPRLPERIEGFDIAHIGGKFPVASLISFWKGNPDKKNYRYFRLKTTNGVIDDFASMREAATRRYSRLSNENAELPDLILIDGGIGQVNAVDGILNMLGLDIPIAGLAKRDEEIWRPHASHPICLPRRSDALRLLQRVRDETHRFATSRNQNLRTKENTVSVFASLPHVGEKREKILIKTFTTLENLAASQEAQIAQALHVRAPEASEILLAARAELEKRNETKNAKKTMFQAQLGSLSSESEQKDESYASTLADAALE
ncbi:MAG: excinuclease ABC subunit UvrC [Treponema sp.]|uniref:excinuclease ABC subunit UvrC n=1 Tax=Treponema sp. TaxID=166 RepID=UPI002A91B40B|nr:excinuclease ABC subunit UvrC [Treponema sp.]MDY6398535.1 excinuclease ABC subunit UvrC [Treponema sp.]